MSASSRGASSADHTVSIAASFPLRERSPPWTRRPGQQYGVPGLVGDVDTALLAWKDEAIYGSTAMALTSTRY